MNTEAIRFRTQIDKENIVNIIKKIFDKNEVRNCEFLEIGCDTGEIYDIIKKENSDVKYYGIDINENAILKAQKKWVKSNACFKVMDARKMLFDSKKFDIVFARMLFEEYAYFQEEIGKEIARVCKDSGIICIHFLNSMVPFYAPKNSISTKFNRGCKILEEMKKPLYLQAYDFWIKQGIKLEIEFLQRDSINPGRKWIKEYYFSERTPIENDKLVEYGLMTIQELKEYNYLMRQELDKGDDYICFFQVLLWKNPCDLYSYNLSLPN